VINAGGRIVKADLATKSVRKAVKTLTESGVANVTLIIQGSLSTDGLKIEEAGLVANIKTQAAPAAAA
jgi:hypothetical protein